MNIRLMCESNNDAWSKKYYCVDKKLHFTKTELFDGTVYLEEICDCDGFCEFCNQFSKEELDLIQTEFKKRG